MRDIECRATDYYRRIATRATMLTLHYLIDHPNNNCNLDLLCGDRTLTSFTCYYPYDELRKRYRNHLHDLKTTTEDVDGEDVTTIVDFGRIRGVYYYSIMHQGETAWMDIPEECNETFLEFLDALIQKDSPKVVTNIPVVDPQDRVRGEIEKSLETMESTQRHLRTHRYT